MGSNHMDVAVISQDHLSWGSYSCTQTGKIPQREWEIDFQGAPYFPASSNSKLEATLNKQKKLSAGVLGSSDVIRKNHHPPGLLLLFSGFCQDNTFLIIVWNPEKACSHCFQNMGTKAGIKWWLNTFSGVILSHTRLSIASPFPRKSGKSRDSPCHFRV